MSLLDRAQCRGLDTFFSIVCNGMLEVSVHTLKLCIANPCHTDTCEGFIILHGALACIESLTLLVEIGCFWGNINPICSGLCLHCLKVPITHLFAGEICAPSWSSYLGHNASHWAFGFLTYHVSIPSLRLRGATLGSCEVISVFLLNLRNDISFITDSSRA